MIVVVEIEAAVDAAGTVEKFLFSTEGWTTLPTDSPANTHVQPRLLQAANYRRELFSGARTFGAVRSAYGECKLANLDGKLDTFARYGFDGRAYRLWIGEKGAAFPSAFTCVLTATMKCALFELTESSGAVRLLLRDRLADLEKPLVTAMYAGDGTDGENAGAQGLRKARVYGAISGCEPQLINDALLLYSVGTPRPGYGVRPGFVTDGLAFLQFDQSYATLTDLKNSAPAPGYWSYCSAAGAFKIGTTPTFGIGASALETGGATTARPGSILRAMAIDAGVPQQDIAGADVDAVDAARTAGYGYRVDSDETALSAMSKIAGSASLWFAFDATGVLRMGEFTPPADAPGFAFTQHNVLKIQRLDSEDMAVPVARVVARSSHNWFPQSAFAGSVPMWFREYFSTEWPMETVAEDAAIRTKHPGAGELVLDVYTGNVGGVRADDGGEAARTLALYGIERDLVQITVPVTQALLAAVDLAKVVMLKYPRFGWDAGKLMRVVAISINLDAMRAEITLWG